MTKASSLPPIICLSHLAWEQTLFQRPQQIMSRLARRGHEVLYLGQISNRRWWGDLLRGQATQHRHRAQRLDCRNRPGLPGAERLAPVRALDVRLAARGIRHWLRGRSAPVLWLCHPDHLSLADRLPHRALIYDVMDHFASFKQTHPRVAGLEDALLRRADLVFTGGRALQEAIAGRRPDAHCFPSGVDLEHFARARDPATPIPPDIAKLRRPVLGYFGAIDERLDLGLIRALCRARRDWTLVFLGPLIRGTALAIGEPNFHWLGPKPYALLPNYLRAFDVCLMPWAQTPLTAHLSPTKTPEYLAGGKPVVAVPIPDVQRDYGDVVFFGETPEGFAAAIAQALAAGDRDWAATLIGRPAARTWDQIAAEMDELLDSLIGRAADSKKSESLGGTSTAVSVGTAQVKNIAHWTTGP